MKAVLNILPKQFTGPAEVMPEQVRPPQGSYSSGIDNVEFAAELGALTAYWLHIEEKMISTLGVLLGGSSHRPRQIYRSIVGQDARIKVMRSLLEESSLDRNMPLLFEEIIDEFSALNGIRDQFVHGLWFTHESQRIFLAVATTDKFAFMRRREVEIGELTGAIERMSKLWFKISDAIESATPRRKKDP